MMTDENIQAIMDLADSLLQEPPTKEEAIRSLQRAGILDEDGKLSPEYQELAEVPDLNPPHSV